MTDIDFCLEPASTGLLTGTGVMDESTPAGKTDSSFCPECCVSYIGGGGGHGLCITEVSQPLGRRFPEVFWHVLHNL